MVTRRGVVPARTSSSAGIFDACAMEPVSEFGTERKTALCFAPSPLRHNLDSVRINAPTHVRARSKEKSGTATLSRSSNFCYNLEKRFGSRILIHVALAWFGAYRQTLRLYKYNGGTHSSNQDKVPAEFDSVRGRLVSCFGFCKRWLERQAGRKIDRR